MKRPQTNIPTTERKIPRSGTNVTPANYPNHRVNICTRTNERRFTVPYKNEIDNHTNYLKQIIKGKMQTMCTNQNANLRCVNFADTQVFVDYMIFDRENVNDRIKFADKCYTPISSIDQNIVTIRLDGKGQLPNFCEGLGDGRLGNGVHNIKKNVFIPIVVNNYVTSGGEHAAHVVNAFKHNSILYCFNPWGGVVTNNHPDADIFEAIRLLYGCTRKIVYKGEYLQLHNQPTRGSCASWGSFFGEVMYSILLQDHNNNNNRNNNNHMNTNNVNNRNNRNNRNNSNTNMNNTTTNSNTNMNNRNNMNTRNNNFLSTINSNYKLDMLIGQHLRPGSHGFTPVTFFKRVRMAYQNRNQNQNGGSTNLPESEFLPIQRKYVRRQGNNNLYYNTNLRNHRELIG